MGSHRWTPVYPAHTSARQGSLSPRHRALRSRTLPGTGTWGRATSLAKLDGHGAKKKVPLLLPKARSKGEEKPRHRKILEIAPTPLATKPPREGASCRTSPPRAGQRWGDIRVTLLSRVRIPPRVSECCNTHLCTATSTEEHPKPLSFIPGAVLLPTRVGNGGTQTHAWVFGAMPAEEIPSPAAWLPSPRSRAGCKACLPTYQPITVTDLLMSLPPALIHSPSNAEEEEAACKPPN